MLHAEELTGKVGIQKALVEEQGDDPAAPDLGEGLVGPQGDEEEAVVAVEAALRDDAVPVGMPDAELAEGLIRDDGGVAEEAREDVEEQPADLGEEIPDVSEEHTRDFRDFPDELTVGQAQQQVLAEVLAEQEGPLLGARWAETARAPPKGRSLLQEKERNRSTPHAGHLMRAMP